MLATTPAAAAAPTQFFFEVDQTVPAPGLSAACGFDVFVTMSGTAHVLLFFNDDGSAVAREIDLA
ncbi:MAG TPA: hypothetical protein VLD61_05075, partial [Methylomirabilota bacterium]|nr:hypothetical protein [Methylomirabilota bacterium]